ncbi:MAG TPA: hypothetical protein VIL34_11485 [Actinopolymorphaceae bacterium]|jgi:hypothetical protein
MDVFASLGRVLDQIIGFIPNLISFLILLVVGYIVAKLVGFVVRKVLQKADVDERVDRSEARRYMRMLGPSPSRGIGRVAFWLVFIFFLFPAIGALNIPAITAFANQVVSYVPNIIAAVLIFIVAALIAGAVASGIRRVMGESPTARIAATALPALVMVIAVFMILQQLRIAPEIVQIAFAATMGAVALGLALAFGLGGRPVAQRMLEDAYTKGQEQREHYKREREAKAREKVPQMREPSEAEARQREAVTEPRPTGGARGGKPDEPPRTP